MEALRLRIPVSLYFNPGRVFYNCIEAVERLLHADNLKSDVFQTALLPCWKSKRDPIKKVLDLYINSHVRSKDFGEFLFMPVYKLVTDDE